MLGDKAYDDGELREELDERGTKLVIPNRSNQDATVQILEAPLQAALTTASGLAVMAKSP